MSFFNSRKRIVITMLVVGLVVLGALVTTFELQYRGKFFPHTIVAGEDVGGRTYAEVMDKARLTVQRLETEGFLVHIASSTIKIPAFSQGLTPDTVVEYFTLGEWQAALEKVYQQGRRGALLERIGGQLDIVLGGREIQFPYVLQETAVRSLLDRELDQVLQKKREAEFRITDGFVAIQSDVTGEAVDHEEIISALKHNLETLGATEVSVVVSHDVPDITTKRLEIISDFAEELAKKSRVSVKFENFSASISGLKLAGWLTLKNEPGTSVAINRDKLEAYVRGSVDPYVAGAAINSRFEMRDGVLVETTSGRAGRAVDINSFYEQLSDAVSNMYLQRAFGNEQEGAVAPIKLTVPLITEAPRVTKETISAYGIRDLVGTITTSFKGSTADRIHNIKVGLATINGMLLAPGQEFSAVESIGEVTAETGYVEEFVIKGNESVKEFGGGLCQIATTLFRLALNAGLPVTERMNHKYVVGYYGPGLDATIYGPHPDFKFVNDTKGYLLLQGRIVGTSLILELYGQKDGRTATVTEPVITDRIPPPPPKYITTYELGLGVQKCTESARYGQTADVTYAVTYPDGHSNTQNFHSVYQPWAKVCLIGISLTAPVVPSFFEGVH